MSQLNNGQKRVNISPVSSALAISCLKEAFEKDKTGNENIVVKPTESK